MVNIVTCIMALWMGLIAYNGFGQGLPVKGYRLVWSDEFEGNRLDAGKWGLRSPGKRGDAIVSAGAVRLDGSGNLVISAKREGDVVHTGLIDTEGRFRYRYGYLECRVKTCSLPGLWCSVWLQSSTNQENGKPSTEGLEIDIFEYAPHAFRDSLSHTLHWGGYGRTHQVFGPFYSGVRSSNDGFHIVGFLWTRDEYRIFVDGVETQRTGMHISHVPEFIVVSLEADRKVAGPLRYDRLPDSFTIDYIRVYQRL